MNKAFVKEPDGIGDLHCPKCGSLGLAVGREALESHLAPESLRTVAESAFFCPYPTCAVAYFDQFGRTVGDESLKRPVYPKDPEAPICGCFGFTRDDIERDVREGVVRRCRELIAKAKSPEARCAIMSASGQCCIPEVQAYFMRFRSQWQAKENAER